MEKIVQYRDVTVLRYSLTNLYNIECKDHSNSLSKENTVCYVPNFNPDIIFKTKKIPAADFCKEYKDNAYLFYHTLIQMERLIGGYRGSSNCICEPEIRSWGLELHKTHETGCWFITHYGSSLEKYKFPYKESDKNTSYLWKTQKEKTPIPLARNHAKILAKGYCGHKYTKGDETKNFDIDEHGDIHLEECSTFNNIVNGDPEKKYSESGDVTKSGKDYVYSNVRHSFLNNSSGTTYTTANVGDWRASITDTGNYTDRTSGTYTNTVTYTGEEETDSIEPLPLPKLKLTINLTKIKKILVTNVSDILKITIGVIIAAGFLSLFV